jgi:AbrB family looped-hinge helix DNA binding protein
MPLDQAGYVRHSYLVTTTISSKGQVVIPRPIRERQQIRPGDDFLLFELSNGDILLRHVRAPKKSLTWHLRRLQGIQIERSRERVREVVW